MHPLGERASEATPGIRRTPGPGGGSTGEPARGPAVSCVRMAKLDSLLKISLDELRMQMLGSQVVFGFQFHAVFQDRLDVSSGAIQAAALLGMGCMVLTMGTLIAAPAVHRMADGGEASQRTRRLISRLAHTALLMLACGLAATVFVTIATEFGYRAGLAGALLMAAVSLIAWYAWGLLLRPAARQPAESSSSMNQSHGSLHDRIDYVLTEARVMLPGAQVLFGFQLLVPLMNAFETLPLAARIVHFAALSLIAATIVLLISPAAIHRIAFDGADDERFLRLSSMIVTIALMPLALGVAGELYVATARLLPESSASGWIAASAICALVGLWYALPLALRSQRSTGPATGGRGT